MANVKITGLTAITAPANTDVLPIVDVSADVTKKVSVADLLESAGDGTAALPAFSFDSEKDIGMFRPGANQLGFATNAVQRLTIAANGNIGIGETNPSQRLEVAASAPRVRITDNDTTASTSSTFLEFYGSNARAGVIYTDSNGLNVRADNTGGGNLLFWTGTSEKMRVSSVGDVGIGTSTPSAKLEINEAAGSSTPAKMKFVNEGERGVTVGFADHNAAPEFAISNGDQTVDFLSIATSGKITINSPTTSEGIELYADGRAFQRVDNISDTGSVWGIYKNGYDASAARVQIKADGSATFAGPLTVSNLASGFSTFSHPSGNGGIKIAGSAGGSNANLVFSNNYTGTIDDIWTIQMQGADDSLAFRAGGPGDSDVITFTSTGAASFAGRITNGPAWNISASLNQAIIDNGTVYTHRQNASDAVFSAFQGTQGTQNVNIFANGNAKFAGAVEIGNFSSATAAAVYIGSGAVQAFRDSGVNAATSATFIGGRKTGSGSDSTSFIYSDGSAQFDLNVRTGGIQTVIPANAGSNNLFNFFQSKKASTDINTAFADSGGAQVVRLYNNGNAIFNGAVTAQSYVTSSDQRFKENITNANSQLADVTALGNKLRNWDWTADAPVVDKDTRFLGLVAQEAETICPGIVKTIARTKQGAELTPEVVVPAVYETRTVPAVLDDKGEVVEAETTEQVLVTEEQITPATYEELDDSYKGISNDALIMKLLGAVAELSAKVAALEAG